MQTHLQSSQAMKRYHNLVNPAPSTHFHPVCTTSRFPFLDYLPTRTVLSPPPTPCDHSPLCFAAVHTHALSHLLYLCTQLSHPLCLIVILVSSSPSSLNFYIAHIHLVCLIYVSFDNELCAYPLAPLQPSFFIYFMVMCIIEGWILM